MKVLVITGDKRFGPGNERYDLQKSALEVLDALYWGRGALWPRVPQGTYDVVTTQDPFLRGVVGWYLARRIRARLNVQVHADLHEAPWWKRLLARIVLKRADSVRVVSEKIKQQIKHSHIVVLPVYVNIERFKTIVRSPEPHTILWIGRFEEEKDPFLALRIAREAGATLIMLGTGSLQEKLQKTGGAEFPGWGDPLPYLARATLVLSTSRHESWGASIIEALAAGVPVVAPDVGVAREAGAIVVPPERLGEAVKEVLTRKPTGTLLVTLPTKKEWQEKFKQSLQ